MSAEEPDPNAIEIFLDAPAFRQRPVMEGVPYCPVPTVKQLDMDIIPDCSIPEVPIPFFESPVQIPYIPPPVMGCFPIRMTTEVLRANPADDLVFAAEFDPINQDNCEPHLKFQLSIPFGCPSFVSTKTPTHTATTFGTGGLVAGITKAKRDGTMYVDEEGKVIPPPPGDPDESQAPDCRYGFGVSATFPCTSFNLEPVTPPEASFTRPGTLKFMDPEREAEGGACYQTTRFAISFPCTKVKVLTNQFETRKSGESAWSTGALVFDERERSDDNCECDMKLNLRGRFPCTMFEFNTDLFTVKKMETVNPQEPAKWTGTIVGKPRGKSCTLGLESDLVLTLPVMKGWTGEMVTNTVEITNGGLKVKEIKFDIRNGVIVDRISVKETGSVSFTECPKK